MHLGIGTHNINFEHLLLEFGDTAYQIKRGESVLHDEYYENELINQIY